MKKKPPSWRIGPRDWEILPSDLFPHGFQLDPNNPALGKSPNPRAKKVQAHQQRTRRLKFVRNTCYEGVDYGPDYETDTVDVDEVRAERFLAQGRAQELLRLSLAERMREECPHALSFLSAEQWEVAWHYFLPLDQVMPLVGARQPKEELTLNAKIKERPEWKAIAKKEAINRDILKTFTGLLPLSKSTTTRSLLRMLFEQSKFGQTFKKKHSLNDDSLRQRLNEIIAGAENYSMSWHRNQSASSQDKVKEFRVSCWFKGSVKPTVKSFVIPAVF